MKTPAFYNSVYILIAALCSLSTPLLAHDTDMDQRQVGSVNFPISCNKQAVASASHGLALMHHMTYVDAKKAFEKAASEDADCAMAYWGIAMTYIHPLWSDPPEQDEYTDAQANLAKAKNTGSKAPWEQDYISALDVYLETPWDKNEKPRLKRFAQAWEDIYQKYPEDTEAAALYALMFLSTADPSDKSYATQLETGKLAGEVLQQLGDHPGGHHYTIHAYDYPPLAKKALDVAFNYGKIAPEIPHALHMPTHIFTREGMWKESIEGNIRSAEAAWKNPAGNAVSLHYLHALDYLAYAYLQIGQDKKASDVLVTMRGIEGPIQSHGASAYALAAIPGRIALERQDWQAASAINPREPQHYAWDKAPAMEAISYFSRALGAAHTGNHQLARQDIAKLAELQDQLATPSPYWATQVEIQRLSALAWLEYQTDQSRGLETMTAAAELEASTEKHPITPSEVLPAHELLADMLRDQGQYAEALAKYQAALARSPNRLNSLYGAGFASEKMGDKKQAAGYFQQLLELTGQADTQLEQVDYAKAYLGLN